jgi:NADH:ubiquinone reductase (non-electrogenic)
VTIPYDYLVYAVGCENQTFGIEGVPKYACFLKELSDADKIRTRLLDCELFILQPADFR